MSAAGIFAPHEPELERFLYASVGEDRKGMMVSVLSAFARLNLDPWKEAADLAALDQEAARSRLGALLSRFWDVPALGKDHGSVARDLTRLLPQGSARAATLAGPATKRAGMPPGMAWAILAVLFLLMQVFVSSPGSSE